MNTPRRVWLLLLSLIGVGLGPPADAQPVEYVRGCPVEGTSFFYSLYFEVPQSETCAVPATGEMFSNQSSSEENFWADTQLAARVRALESDYCDDCFGAVRKDGTPRLAESENMQSSSRIGAGRYEVLFIERVDQCAIVATLGTGSRHPPGTITVARTPDTDNGISVPHLQRLGQAG